MGALTRSRACRERARGSGYFCRPEKPDLADFLPSSVDTFRGLGVVSGGAMARRDEIAGRMAEAVVKRLVTRKLADIKDEPRAREVVRQILSENFLAEEKIEPEVKALLLENAKLIKDSASDYKRLFTLANTNLPRERGVILWCGWGARASSAWHGAL